MSLRLTDEEFDLALKPVVNPCDAFGHWRAVWRLNDGFYIPPESLAQDHGWVPFGDDWLSPNRFLTEAECEAAALHHEELWRDRPEMCEWRYVRAEYFPDYPSGGA